jgi:hypothetical protein
MNNFTPKDKDLLMDLLYKLETHFEDRDNKKDKVIVDIIQKLADIGIYRN